MDKRFCPKCGKDIDEKNIDGFCIDCYIQDHDVCVVPVFDINYCPVCGTYKYANKVYKDKQALENDLLKHVKTKHLDSPKISINLVIDDQKKEYFSEITIRVLVGNKIIKINKKQKINYKKELCVFCSRVAGNYYTTIIQVRFDTKKLQEKMLDVFRKRISDLVKSYNNSQTDAKNKMNIVKEKEENGGIDVYVNELTHGQRIVSMLSKSKYAYDTKYSKTLMGIFKNGKQKFRYTLCVHFKE